MKISIHLTQEKVQDILQTYVESVVDVSAGSVKIFVDGVATLDFELTTKMDTEVEGYLHPSLKNPSSI